MTHKAWRVVKPQHNKKTKYVLWLMAPVYIDYNHLVTQGQVVQSVVSLTISLVVKMLTVL